MSITVMKKEARDVAKRLEARLEKAIEEDRNLTDEEETEDKADNQRLDKLMAQIEQAEKVAARVSAVAKYEITEDESEKQAKKPEDRPKFSCIGEFATAVLHATDPHGQRIVDTRLAAPSNFHQEGGDGTQTGYMVPAQFRQEIWELAFGQDDLISLVDSEPTNSNSVEFNADESTPWGASGVQAYWRSEAGQMTGSKLSTEGRTVKVNELYAFVSATEELLQDAPRLNARLTKKAAQAINWKANDAILYGDGVGKPLGWFGHASEVSVSKESGQAADTVVAKNVAKMFSRNLNPGRSVWLVNSDVIPELVTMTLGDQPIWTPPTEGIKNTPGGNLLGRPVIITDHAKTVGDKGDIMFVDPMGYYVPLKQGGVEFAESIHLYFDYNMRAFRWIFRMGGQPYLIAPVTPANGSTKSHIVTLAARS